MDWNSLTDYQKKLIRLALKFMLGSGYEIAKAHYQDLVNPRGKEYGDKVMADCKEIEEMLEQMKE